jgi:hypothetical protein
MTISEAVTGCHHLTLARVVFDPLLDVPHRYRGTGEGPFCTRKTCLVFDDLILRLQPPHPCSSRPPGPCAPCHWRRRVCSLTMASRVWRDTSSTRQAEAEYEHAHRPVPEIGDDREELPDLIILEMTGQRLRQPDRYLSDRVIH